MVNAVYQHRRHQAGVKDLDSQHPVDDDEPFPYRIDRRVVRRQLKQPFDPADLGCGGGKGQTETVSRSDRPRRHRPEFDDVLRHDKEPLAGVARSHQTVGCGLILPMVRLRQPQQHVGIDENAHRPRGRP